MFKKEKWKSHLSHVADDNGHDDPIDGNSFTEDDATTRQD